MTYEAIIQLAPIESRAIEKRLDDDCSDKNNLKIVEGVRDRSSAGAETIGQQYTANQLTIKTYQRGVFLGTETGETELFSGDEIIANNQRYLVNITHTIKANVAESAALSAPITPTLMTGDIWESDILSTPIVAPAPFITQPVTSSVASLSQTVHAHTNDPLNFLYDTTGSTNHDPNALLPSVALGSSVAAQTSTPNYFSDSQQPMLTNNVPHLPTHQGNVLDELGIDQTTLSNNIAKTTVNSALDETPADRLDEYLSFDEERYNYQPSTNASSTTMPSAENHSDASLLQGMRSLFKNRSSS